MSTQTWDPNRYAQNARFVSDLGWPVVELLAPKAGERILDLGCGDGALTQKIAALGCEVTGVDGSADQIAAAKQLGFDARVVDCQTLEFDGEFDAVFSNAALHWMKRDPDAVIAGVRRALRPGGRFVAEMGGAGCVQTVKAAIKASLRLRGIDPTPLDPWYFPTVEEYSERLRAHGFEIDFISLFDRPTDLPGPLTDWLATFAEPFTSALPLADRRALCEEVQEAARPRLCDATGHWRADYVRLRFAAHIGG
jgi:trans-aconitate methyltransferase